MKTSILQNSVAILIIYLKPLKSMHICYFKLTTSFTKIKNTNSVKRFLLISSKVKFYDANIINMDINNNNNNINNSSGNSFT